MPVFSVCGVGTYTTAPLEIEAETEQEAIEKFIKSDDCYVSVCHQCSANIELGDIEEESVVEL